jgi:hypothetical protein
MGSDERTMRMRLVAWVGTTEYPPPVIHFKRMPPENVDIRENLPWPKLLLIEPGIDGGFLLYRYADHETCAGDTWHSSVEDAKHQASYEYGKLLSDWQEVPQDIEDPVVFAFEHQP